MKLNLGGIQEREIEARLSTWPRIIDQAHCGTPCDAGFGSSRFSSPTRAFKVLYAAESFATAFSEAIIRDRFVGKSIKYLFLPSLEDKFATAISSSAALKLLDFTGPAAYELGIDTDSKGARAHTKGQEFAEALHDQTSLDGIIFDSRLTGRKCIAIFDRAFGLLTASPPQKIIDLEDFWNEIDRQKITVRRKRGLST